MVSPSISMRQGQRSACGRVTSLVSAVVTGFGLPARSLSLRHAPRPLGRRSKAATKGDAFRRCSEYVRNVRSFCRVGEAPGMPPRDPEQKWVLSPVAELNPTAESVMVAWWNARRPTRPSARSNCDRPRPSNLKGHSPPDGANTMVERAPFLDRAYSAYHH